MYRISFTRLSLRVFCSISAIALSLSLSLAAQDPKQDQRQDAKKQEVRPAPPPASPEPTSADLSRDETPGKALARIFGYQEYEVRSTAEAMPADKWDYRPAPALFKDEEPAYGPAQVRTFAEQVKHVACSNFAFAAELDGTKPPDGCEKGGPSPAKTHTELLTYLRDSFVALTKSLSAVTQKNMYDPIEGPYATPNTRLGLAEVCVWHAADHYGQMVIYLRENNIVPPTSRAKPPKLQEKY
jgi:DinB family protein